MNISKKEVKGVFLNEKMIARLFLLLQRSRFTKEIYSFQEKKSLSKKLQVVSQNKTQESKNKTQYTYIAQSAIYIIIPPSVILIVIVIMYHLVPTPESFE
jgi:transposase-like protein